METLESETVCPNCGYQIKPDDYYCPSCRHRVEFAVPPLEPVTVAENPGATKSFSRYLSNSALVYLASVSITAGQFIYASLIAPINADLDSSLMILSTLLATAACFILSVGGLRNSGSIGSLRVPSALLIMLGISNFLLAMGYISIFPSSTTLQTIFTSIVNNGATPQLAMEYAAFFLLVGFAVIAGVVGSIGIILLLRRGARILSSHLISYGLAAGIILAILDGLLGIPVLIIVAPLLIYFGSRNGTSSQLSNI